MNKIILDLCGGTGAWSKPYMEAGYDVRNITLPEYDIKYYIPPNNVHGVLAAPPCTDFAVSGARWWAKKDGNVALLNLSMLDIVLVCLQIIEMTHPSFWALENPVGRLYHWLGKPRLIFQPYEYGDPWTKRTCIWGKFNIPQKHPVEPVGQWIGKSNTHGIVDHYEFLPGDWIHKLPPSPNRSLLRSITPPGFAKAFFEANQ